MFIKIFLIFFALVSFHFIRIFLNTYKINENAFSKNITQVNYFNCHAFVHSRNEIEEVKEAAEQWTHYHYYIFRVHLKEEKQKYSFISFVYEIDGNSERIIFHFISP